jgi:hypothetical protein
MFGCALAAAVFGMWYRYQVTRRSLELWGAPAAVLIARAPKIEAMRFDPPLSAEGPVSLDTLRTETASSKEVTDSRGMLNVRQAFVEDSTFLWQQSAAGPPAWSYALVFSDGERQTAVLFDSGAQTVGSPATGKPVSLEPKASEELLAFFQEQFKPAKAK